MKKKLTVNTLALGNLKKRRRQYTVMIMGIVLAMLLSSAVILFIAGVAETAKHEKELAYGSQDAIIYVNCYTEESYENDIQKGVLESCGFAHTIGYAYPAEGEENLGASVAWLDDETKALSNQTFLAGRYPEDENEIAIEQTALAKLGWENAEIGDEITLLLKVQDNEEYGETIAKTYILSGIAADKKSNLDMNAGSTLIPALFVSQNTQTEPGGHEMLVAYATIDESHGYFADSETGYHIALFFYYLGQAKEWGAETKITADSVLSDLSEGLRTDNANGYIVCVLIILCFASCTAIVNAFNANLKERKKQIGMLRAVGATRRQIINIFSREALMVSLIATPVSLALSCLLVRTMLGILYDSPVMLKSLFALPVSAVVQICVVMLATLPALLGASRITPQQAIRGISRTRRMKTKKIKSKKEFSPARHIAKRSLTFARGQLAAPGILLAAAILISAFAFSYLSFLGEEVSAYTAAYRYDYCLRSNTDMNSWEAEWDGDTESNNASMGAGALSELRELSYISEIYAQKAVQFALHTDEISDYLKILRTADYYGDSPSEAESYDDYKALFSSAVQEEYASTKEAYSINSDYCYNCLFGFDESELKTLQSYVIDGKMDFDTLESGEEIILVAPQTVQLKAKINGMQMESVVLCDSDIATNYPDWTHIAEAECPYRAGDSITMSFLNWDEDTEEFINTEKQVKIGAIVSPVEANDMNFFKYVSWDGTFNFVCLTTTGGVDALYPALAYYSLGINVNTEVGSETDAQITKALEYWADIYGYDILSKYDIISAEVSQYNATYLTVLLFVVMAFLICASLINNAITARIRENKRVIGTLRAVGADIKELTKSYINQMLSMFACGAAAGFGTFGAAFLTIKIIGRYHSLPLGFNFNPWLTAVMASLLFAACCAHVFIKISKEMKNSIVDNIREL